MMGGTREYFCLEQLVLLDGLQTIDDEDAQRTFDEEKMLTPATSDLYQGGLTMLEAYSRSLPLVHLDAKSVPQEAVDRCAARTPKPELEAFSPSLTEAWLDEKCIDAPFESGVLIEKGIGGARLLALAHASGHKELMKECAIKNLTRAKKFQSAILRNVSTRADAIAHDMITVVLRKSLDPAVGERFGTALEVLEGLGAKTDYDTKTLEMVLIDISKAVGADQLPPQVVAEKSSEHSDAIVNSTLGGLTKRLVQYEDVQSALDSCAEWMGVASRDARPEVVSIFCKLWKDYGRELRSLDLSMKAHRHWGSTMLGDEGTMISLAKSLTVSAAASLEHIDLTQQKGLPEGVLAILLGACALPKLQTLKLAGCKGVAGTCGTIPAEIGGCKALLVFDVNNSQFTGACVFHGDNWENASRFFADVSFLYDPYYIRTNASQFNLYFPQITGTIPVEFGQMVNLKKLVLWGNELTGAIVCSIIHNNKCI